MLDYCSTSSRGPGPGGPPAVATAPSRAVRWSGDPAGEIVRGIIDCLVVPAEGPPIILEFKTGDPRPEHATQVARYATAIRSILAVDRVETKILYA